MFSWVYKKSTRLDTPVDTRFEFRDNRQTGDKKKNRNWNLWGHLTDLSRPEHKKVTADASPKRSFLLIPAL